MREPQATFIVGAKRCAMLPSWRRMTGTVRTLATVVTAVFTLSFSPAVASAQIRGSAPRTPSAGWWLSGGASAVTVADINDGASKTKWVFGSDPLVQYRATLEKASDEFTTLGVAVGYGLVDVSLLPLTATANPELPAACQTSCAARTEMWTVMGQFRSGGGPKFHTLFEASGGGTSFRNFKTRDDGLPIAGITNNIDLTGTLGAGFGYPLSPGMVLTLVQDFGIGFHSSADLPDGTGRTWRVRNTRAALRIKFGGR